MERRDFLKSVSAAGLATALDPSYLAAKALLQSGATPSQPVPRRKYGRAEDTLSLIGFGGIVVKDVDPADAARYVSEAFDRGVTYYDVAPTYGNAQERLGPALKPYRAKCFLACKTTERGADGARREMQESLRLLQTDHFDLYQLHAITSLDDVDRAFAAGGAMEVVVQAKKDGKIRYVGFSAHSEEAAHAAMDRYDFDSILFPLSFPTWLKGELRSIGPQARQGRRARCSRVEGDGAPEVAGRWRRPQEAVEQGLVRPVRRSRPRVAGIALHEPPAGGRDDPPGALAAVQDGGGAGAGGRADGAQRAGTANSSPRSPRPATRCSASR